MFLARAIIRLNFLSAIHRLCCRRCDGCCRMQHCDFTAAYKRNIVAHEVCHSGAAKPFACDHCTYTTARHDLLGTCSVSAHRVWSQAYTKAARTRGHLCQHASHTAGTDKPPKYSLSCPSARLSCVTPSHLTTPATLTNTRTASHEQPYDQKHICTLAPSHNTQLHT